jgi:hypothetical protein
VHEDFQEVNMSEKFWKARNVATQLIAPMIVSFYVASYFIESRYPTSIAATGGPRGPEWMYYWRLVSALMVLMFSLLSLPRWQSFAGFLSLVFFAYMERGI